MRRSFSGFHETMRLTIGVSSLRLRCRALNSCRVDGRTQILEVLFDQSSCCFFIASEPLIRGPMSQSCLRYFSARSESNLTGFASSFASPPVAKSVFFGARLVVGRVCQSRAVSASPAPGRSTQIAWATNTRQRTRRRPATAATTQPNPWDIVRPPWSGETTEAGACSNLTSSLPDCAHLTGHAADPRVGADIPAGL